MRNNLNLYTLNERIFLVKTFYRNDSDVNCVKRNFIQEYGVLDDAPADNVIFEIVNLFEETGSVKEIPDYVVTKVEKEASDMDVESGETFLANIKVEQTQEYDENEEAEENLHENASVETKGFCIYFPSEGKGEKDSGNPLKERRQRARRKPPPVKVPLKPSDDTIADGQMACSRCNQKYATKKGLRLHLSRHLQQDPDTCTYCSETFLSTIQYRNHLREKHGDDVKISEKKIKGKCEKAPKSQKLPIACEFCPKTFTLGSLYRKHLVSHSDKRDYICDTCGKAFKKLAPLIRHIKIHTGERPYKCTFPDCDRAYRDMNSLKLHGLCHTDEKPFSCEHCGKCFRDRSYLKIHYRSHTGESPYKCEICGKETKQRQNLKSHMKHFHKINETSN